MIDTSCAALLQLARRVHECGQKVVLTGEGADEWLVGYPWYKAAKLIELSRHHAGPAPQRHGAPRLLALNNVPQYPVEFRAARRRMPSAARMRGSTPTACSGCRSCAFIPSRCTRCCEKANPWADLQMPLERAKRWHPLNRGIWVAGRVTLAGHLFKAKATGWPCIPPWKCAIRFSMRTSSISSPGWIRAGSCAVSATSICCACWPSAGCRRRFTSRKVIFRAPLDSFHMDPEPPFVGATLERGIAAPHRLFRRGRGAPLAQAFRNMRAGSLPRLSVEMGLAAVVATQLWHHIYISGRARGTALEGGGQLNAKDIKAAKDANVQRHFARSSRPSRLVSGSSFSVSCIERPLVMKASAPRPACPCATYVRPSSM